MKLFSTHKERKNYVALLLTGMGAVCLFLCPPAIAHSGPQQKQPVEQSRKPLTGKVVDTGGRPLNGAAVLLRERQERSVTNCYGEFDFSVYTPGDHLEISYIGYESAVVKSDSSGRMEITLSEDSRVLEEPSEPILLPPVKKEEKRPAGKPCPIGGEKAYKQYLDEKMMRPADAECKDKTGNVTVLFSTDEAGKPYNIRIKKGLCPSCDHEAMRLVNEGPKWSHAAENVEISVHF